MQFARFALADALGAILAHSMQTPKGALKKGRTLSRDDLARLEAAGHTHVVAARLDRDDVGEDEAARRIATAAAGSGISTAAPFTGRANLFAEAHGLAVFNADAVRRINGLDEGLTIATLAPYEQVAAGQMVATVKIITFAVPERVVAAAEDILRSGPPLAAVQPFHARTAGLILTRLPATKQSVLKKRRSAIEDRLATLGSRLGPVETVDHEEQAVGAAIRRMDEQGVSPILLFAASAIVDRGDVIPAALEMAGGRIVRLGMPVDPGNMMLLGKLGDKDVVGAPSCAASPKLNGFDWVLERIAAGIEVASGDVAAMGFGGLLKEIATRPQPREGKESGDMADTTGDGARLAPRITALVLAAGRSTRFGPSNKLLADLGGEAVVRHTVRAVLASKAQSVLVVTGHMADEVRAALAGLEVTFVDSPNYRDGLSASLKAGLQALPKTIDGVLIVLGDMPGVTSDDIDRLIAGFAPKEGRSIVVPTHRGKRGNPVVFAAHLVPEMADVAGDAGAKQVIGRHADEVAEVDLGSPRIFVDVDTPEALEQVRKGK